MITERSTLRMQAKLLDKLNWMIYQRNCLETLQENRKLKPDDIEYLMEMVTEKWTRVGPGFKIFDYVAAKEIHIRFDASKQDVYDFIMQNPNQFYSNENGSMVPGTPSKSFEFKQDKRPSYFLGLETYCHRKLKDSIESRVRSYRHIKSCELNLLQHINPELFDHYRSGIGMTLEEMNDVKLELAEEQSDCLFS